jgi:hypothetical protein
MNGSRAPVWSRVGAWTVAAICLTYVPLAGSYFIGFPSAEGPLWTQVQAVLGSRELSFGARSLFAVQHGHYLANLSWMRLHTTFGALCLLLMLPQFSTRLRQRRPGLHRWLGRAALGSGALAMVGAYGFLFAMPFEELYSGKTFGAGLWALALLTSTGLVMGFRHIRRGQVHQHQSWMALTFGFLLTAPFLRVLWVTASRIDPAMHDAWNNNLASESILVPLSVLPALCWQAYGGPSKPLARWDEIVARRRGAQFSVLAAAAALVALNEGILRFVGVPDVVGRALSLGERAAEAEAFARAPLAFALGALGLSGALAAGARLLPAVLSGAHVETAGKRRALSAGLLCAGVGMAWKAAVLDGVGPLGLTGPYFHGGYATFLGLAAVLSLTDATRYPEASRRWTLYGFGLGFVPLIALLGMLPWRAAGMSPGEAYATSIAFALGNPLLFVYLLGTYKFASRPADHGAEDAAASPFPSIDSGTAQPI